MVHDLGCSHLLIQVVDELAVCSGSFRRKTLLALVEVLLLKVQGSGSCFSSVMHWETGKRFPGKVTRFFKHGHAKPQECSQKVEQWRYGKKVHRPLKDLKPMTNRVLRHHPRRADSGRSPSYDATRMHRAHERKAAQSERSNGAERLRHCCEQEQNGDTEARHGWDFDLI